MIEVGKYYICDTPEGSRTLKCLQLTDCGKPYGLYSLSNYQNAGDAQGMEIPTDSPEASLQESQAWDAWFNQ